MSPIGSFGIVFGRVLHIAVEGNTVEWNNDDLAAMVIVSPLLILGNIKGREGETSNMAIFNKDARTLEFMPVVHGPIGVTHEIGGRVIS